MELKLGSGLIFILCAALGANAQASCTSAGRHAAANDRTCKNYTLCVATSNGSFLAYNYTCPGISLFNPRTRLCTTNYICNVTSTNTTTSLCTAEGLFPDSSSTNCSAYRMCVLINDSFIEVIQSCPSGSYFNPISTNCEMTYNCTTPFSCSANGRYANTSDATCKTYYLCVLAANGTFFQYEYTCPSISVFSPILGLCTTTYTCPN